MEPLHVTHQPMKTPQTVLAGILIAALAIVSLTCGIAEAPTSPLTKGADSIVFDSVRIHYWPDRLAHDWATVIVAPVSKREDSGSRYTGMVSPWPGYDEQTYVHWYDWNRDDTLRVDARVRAVCGNGDTIPYTEARVLFRMSLTIPSPVEVIAVTELDTTRYLMARGYVDEVPEPDVNPDGYPVYRRLEYGPWVSISPITPCRADSARLRVLFPHLTTDGLNPPRPLWLYVELRNRQVRSTIVGKIGVGVSERYTDPDTAAVSRLRSGASDDDSYLTNALATGVFVEY